MPSHRQIVTTYQPRQYRAFDQQFWPVFMALCITATILAATVVTLLAGFWMWVSLMVLPAAVAVLLLVLRFVDDRRVRRSLQLAVILSLAAHCVFLIVAHETDVFRGFFLQVNRQTSAVREQRVIHVSRNVETRPWMDVNPTPTPTPEQPQPERQADRDTSTVRPQPSPIENQTPTEQPQLVQRQQISRTVPRLGKNLSELSRQSQNLQPKSSQQVEMAQPAPKSRATESDRPATQSTEISRQTPATSAAQPERNRRERVNESLAANELTRTESREMPAATAAAQPRSEPERRSETRPKTARATNLPPSAAPERPVSSATAEAPRTNQNPVQRRSPATNANRKSSPERRPRSRITETQARPVPRDSQSKPAIDRRLVANQPARANTSAVQPTSPVNAERPAPSREATAERGTGRMKPQPMAISKSTGGTAGVGRAVNLDRDLGSTQSPAINPANSLNRRERTTMTPNQSSLTLQQSAEVPIASASAVVPGSTMRPDSIPLASRAATNNRAEMTASSSAALNQSNSDATRGETSVEKGTGSADLGSTRIVTEITGRRVEGGGQPELTNQPSQVATVNDGDTGSAAPAIAAEMTAPSVTDNLASPGQSQLADMPVANADDNLTARRGAEAAESGEPQRSQSDTAADIASGEAQTALERAGSDDDDDEEERRRQLQGLTGDAESTSESFASDATPQIETASGMDVPDSGSRGQRVARADVPSAAGVASDQRGETAGRANASDRPRRATSSGTGDIASVAPRARGQGGRQQSQRDPGAGDAPGLADTPSGPLGNNGNLTATAPSPEPVGQVVGGTGQSSQINDAANVALLDRDAPAGMSLDIEARTGPAGIGNLPEPDVGVDSRRASRESPAIQSMTETRFRKTETGGSPSVSSAPTIAREAFRSRNRPSRTSAAPQTEESIELGLAFLARQQQSDGSWTLGGFEMDRTDVADRLSSDTAASGLALLAFQGAGYHHKEFKYASRLQNAITWLIDNQQPNGELYISTDENSDKDARFYSHAIATIALTEAYGMTQDDALRQPAQLALDYIAKTQHPRTGGWGYKSGGRSDTSITGWMVMALQSGRLAGLETDALTFKDARVWLDSAQETRQAHLYRYNPKGEDTAEFRRSLGRIPTPSMTAVGLLMRLYIDWDAVDPRIDDGARYLLEHLPTDADKLSRDTYYWYYASQVLKHVGGQAWNTWYETLHPLLVKTQIKEGDLAGSWDPFNPVPDRWGAFGGRMYVTTMNLLSLEVEYRLLPLYEETVVPASRD